MNSGRWQQDATREHMPSREENSEVQCTPIQKSAHPRGFAQVVKDLYPTVASATMRLRRREGAAVA